MILKILEKGSTKVYAPDDQVADYLFLGFTDTGTTTEVVVTDPSKEIVEMNIEDDIVTAFRYKGDPVWRTVAGGGGGTDTYKVKVDGTDTADYLENKLQQGTNVTITKSGGKLVVNSTGGSGGGVTVYADLATLKAVDTTAYTDVQTVQVKSLGLYKFQPLSTLTGDNVNVITPTTGSSAGRWIKQSKDVTSVLEAYSATYKNVSTVLENSEILKLKGNKLGKTIKVVEIGSSVLKGSGATTLAQGYANLLATELSAITEVSISTVNLGVASNTAGSVRDRFDDIVINNPDVLIIGVSTNNSSLYTANAYSSGALMVKTYLRQLSELVALCETRGIQYFIVGEYGYTGATSYGINLKKQLNAQLCKFKNYLNVLGEVADDSCAWKSSAQYDAGHPNDVGHLGMLRGIIREHIYTSNKLKLDFKPQKGYGVIQSGTDSATSAPLMFTPSAWSASALESWTLTFGVRLGTGNYTASRCLLKTKPTNTLAGVGIDVNTSGYITCRDGATLKATSSVKIDTIKEAKIVITSDVIDNLIYIYVNGELLSSFTPANGLGLYNAFVARDNLDVNTRATGYEYNNFVIYQGRMDIYNIQKIFKNDYPQANIAFCHNLDCDSIEGVLFSQNNNGAYCVNGFAGSIISTALHDNIYTDSEKAKLANTVSGTFTTVDGKTITITGGMVTSIV